MLKLIEGMSARRRSRAMRDRFRTVFKENQWGDDQTVSGPGSRRDSESVRVSREALDYLVGTYGVRSIFDIPCGDFNWMPLFLAAHPEVRYIGADIVPEIVAKNKDRHPGVEFIVCDITNCNLPRSDVVFCKDLFNHLTFADVRRALRSVIASKSRYLLASTDADHSNVELPSSRGNESRHLNLHREPFGLSAPIWKRGYLELWEVASLRI